MSGPDHELVPQNITSAAIRPRALRGAAILGLRQVATALVTLVGGVWLARLLSPREFGYYAIAVLVLAFVGSLGDGGLGASLIREPHEPDRHELNMVFTAQLTLASLLAVVGWIATPLLGGAFHLPSAGIHLILIALGTPIIGTLKTVPTILLERQVKYGAIGLSGVVESISFNAVAIAFAATGFGVSGLGYGLIAGAVAGVVTLGVLSPWRPEFTWDLEGIRHHLRFGLPYQGITLISLAKDSISPVFVGLFLGATQVGYVEWAGRLAAYAVLAMFIVQRLLLTTLSRVQHDVHEFAALVAAALRYANAVVAPFAVVTLVFAHPITDLVFGHKWEPALGVFWYLWAANLVVPTATVSMAALNALGESTLTFRFAVLWMVTTWALGVPCILAFGFVGFGIANLLVQFTNFWFFKVASRRFPLPWVRSAAPSWLVAGAFGLVGLAISRLFSTGSYSGLLAGIATSLIGYLIAMVAGRSMIAKRSHTTEGD